MILLLTIFFLQKKKKKKEKNFLSWLLSTIRRQTRDTDKEKIHNKLLIETVFWLFYFPIVPPFFSDFL